MRSPIYRNRAAQVALIAMTLAVSAGAIAAQPVTEITVEAPRSVHIVHAVQVDRRDPAAEMQVTTIKTQVSYGDLDLAKTAGADTLRSRVKVTANEVCQQLDKLYPDTIDGSCVTNAVARASARVEAVIAAATKR